MLVFAVVPDLTLALHGASNPAGMRGKRAKAVFDTSTALGRRREPCQDHLQALLASAWKSGNLFLSSAAHLLVSCSSWTSPLFGAFLIFLILLYSLSQTEQGKEIPSVSLGLSYCMQRFCYVLHVGFCFRVENVGVFFKCWVGCFVYWKGLMVFWLIGLALWCAGE